jgi:succinate dehydrogenase flavin-adding protein (antitoxin of CptAB toxin-antitoxin module)
MLELDLLLQQVLEQQYPGFNAKQRQDFIRLLEYPDQSLQSWLLGDGQEVDAGVREIVRTIRSQLSR